MDDVRREIDLRLDGLLGEVGKVLGDVFEKLEDGTSELRHSQDIQTSKGPVRAEAGIRVRMGGATFGGGSDTVEPTIQPVNTSRQDSEARAISASILSEPGLWNLTADLPGVAEDGLTLDVTGGTLTIEATASARRYYGQFEVPGELTRDAITVSLKNGILDLTAPLIDEAPS